MSSTADAGYYASEQVKIKATKCEKSKDGKHKWKTHGGWPSTWSTCDHCKITTYSK